MKQYQCPDCKIELTKEDIIDSTYTDPKGNGIGYDIPIYQCPKCKSEYEEEEL